MPLLLTANASFANNLSKASLHQDYKILDTMNKVTETLSHKTKYVYVFAIQVFRKHLGKSRSYVIRAVSPLSTVFFSLWRTFLHFHQFEIVDCKLFQYHRVKNVSFGKGVKFFLFFLKISSLLTI